MKKGCGPQKGYGEKRWQPRNGCDGRLMAKILIMTIQVNVYKYARIVVVKFFAINLPSQPFLGRHLGFHILFQSSFLGAALFFHSSAVLV